MCDKAVDFAKLLPEDADEVFENWVCDMLTVFRGVGALLTPGNVDLASDGDIKMIKESAKGDRGPLCLIKDMFLTVPFYRDLLEGWELAAPWLKTSGRDVTRLRAQLKTLVHAVDLDCAGVHVKAILEITDAKEKLRAGACDEVEKLLQTSLDAFFRLVLQDHSENVPLFTLLEKLAQQAAVFFPAVADFKKATQDIQAKLSKVDNMARLDRLLEAVKTLSAKVVDGGVGCEVADILNLEHGLAACKGLKLADPEWFVEDVLIWVPKVTDFLARSLGEMLPISRCLGVLASLLESHMCDRLTPLVQAVKALRSTETAVDAMMKFEALGTSLESRIAADIDMRQMKTLMVARKVLQTSQATAFSPNVQKQIDECIKRVSTVISQSGELVHKKDTADFTARLSELMDINGGAARGSHWYDGCADLTDWDALSEHATATLLKISPDGLKKATIALDKA
jgi:hypothetical protein